MKKNTHDRSIDKKADFGKDWNYMIDCGKAKHFSEIVIPTVEFCFRSHLAFYFSLSWSSLSLCGSCWAIFGFFLSDWNIF